MKRAVFYLRMSTSQQEKSIPEQRDALNEKFKAKYSIIGEYKDEGISGDDTARRKEFQRMLKDAMRGGFEVILCYDQDRFGRFDSIEAGFWIKPLRDAGVRLETIANGAIDWNDFGGRLIYSVVQEGKHAYLRDLSRNTLRGQLATVRAGYWTSGPPPYGYRLSETKPRKILLGDSQQVAIVKRLFNDYLAGYSLREVASRLNQDGIPAPKGGLWHQSMVKRIVSNPIYMGDYAWNRRSEGKYHRIVDGGISESGKQGSGDQAIVVPNAAPPIVDRRKFASVQKKLTEQQAVTTPIRGGGDMLLNKLLICENCGSRMYGIKQARNGERFYVCGGWHLYGPEKCIRRSVRQDVVISLLQDQLIQTMLSPENLEEAFRYARSVNEREITPVVNMADLDRKIAAAKKRLVEVDSDLVSVVQDHLRKLMNQKESVKSSKAKVQQETLRLSDVRKFFEQMKAKLKSADPTLLRSALKESVESVVISFDNKEVKFIKTHIKTIELVQGSPSPCTSLVISGDEYQKRLQELNSLRS